MSEPGKFAVKLGLTAVLTPVIKGFFALLQTSVEWWIAAAIAMVVVFGIFFIFIDGDVG